MFVVFVLLVCRLIVICWVWLVYVDVRNLFVVVVVKLFFLVVVDGDSDCSDSCSGSSGVLVLFSVEVFLEIIGG